MSHGSCAPWRRARRRRYSAFMRKCLFRAASGWAMRCTCSKREAHFLELRGESAAHVLDVLPGAWSEGDVRHVVHAAGDDDLEYAFLLADVAERAADAGRQRDGVELLEDHAPGTVVVPGHFEAPLEHGKGLVGLDVVVQPRSLAGRADGEGHGHAGGAGDRRA